ncbi:Zn-dependent alcohol dehydrogenase [Pelomyxa schiedti]|nr:Zn-dependent alcohol dehydrogenase [Pelomyxa schiedti]
MHTRAAVLWGTGQRIQVENVELGGPRRGEVVVRMEAAGVCHSDWHIVTGDTKHPMPVALGHEGAGVVEVVGEGVDTVTVGDCVALVWSPSCGKCFYCVRDEPSLCVTYEKRIWDGTMLDGTPRFTLNGKPIYHHSSLGCFADRVTVPECCCIRMPKEVPADVRALIGCCVATGVGAALRTAPVHPGDIVAVFGVGGVGLSIVMGARAAGASAIIVVDRTRAKEQLARHLGATHFVLSEGNVPEKIRSLTEGRGADVCFEAVGLPILQQLCVECIRPGGTCVLVGLAPMGSTLKAEGEPFARYQKKMHGSNYGSSNPARDFPLLGQLYLSGKLPVNDLISRHYTLDQVNEAFADMLSGSLSGRGVIMFPPASKL